MSVYVKNVEYSTTVQEFREVLEQRFGATSRLWLCLNKETGCSRGFGFVDFECDDSKECAISTGQVEFHGQMAEIIRVDKSRPLSSPDETCRRNKRSMCVDWRRRSSIGETPLSNVECDAWQAKRSSIDKRAQRHLHGTIGDERRDDERDFDTLSKEIAFLRSLSCTTNSHYGEDECRQYYAGAPFEISAPSPRDLPQPMFLFNSTSICA